MRCKAPSGGTICGALGTFEICENHYQETADYLNNVQVGVVTVDPDLPGIQGPDPRTFPDKDPDLDLAAVKAQNEEYTAALQELDPQDNEEWAGLVSVLHDSIDEHETLDDLRKQEGEPHYSAWKEVNDRYRAALDSAKGLVDTVKAVILGKRLLMEEAQFEAMAKGEEVPNLFEDPPGLSFPPAELSIQVTDLAQIPVDFLCTAVDMEKVANALTADPERKIPGISYEWVRKVLFRRPS